MRTFEYDEYPTGRVRVTEETILRDYYPIWCNKMRSVGKDDSISEEHCIQDWCIIHGAWEVET